MSLRIASWNINSVRIRLPLLARLVKELAPDILCLQETKVEDNSFPEKDIRALGFPHLYISGQKSYNGVAIASKQPLTHVHSHDFAGLNSKRHIGARLENGAELHCMYVPAGGDIPDPVANPKFDDKLRFMAALIDWANGYKRKQTPLIMLGDMNIAPLPNDVWSHKQMLGVVSHTPQEVALMENLRSTLSWVDSARHFTPESEKLYSWWSYRNRDWEKSDRGRRLDHIWVTPQLNAHLVASHSMKAARGWDSPSDHIPIAIDLQ